MSRPVDADGFVLVGVDGTDGGHAAIRYAAEEARRLGAGIRLVHVVPDYDARIPGGPLAHPAVSADPRPVGTAILAAAQRELAELTDVPATTLLLSGSPVEALVRAAPEARLVVLGDDRRSLLARIATGSVLAGVAAHAPVPVVAVPAPPTATDHGRVLAAAKDGAGLGGLVRRALEAAEQRGAELVVLHAWQLPLAYEHAALVRDELSDWDEQSRQQLEHAVSRLCEGSPGVPVRVETSYDQPARAIVRASAGADLVLLVRRPHVLPSGHLGSVGRAVLRESRCPVEVVPAVADPIDTGRLVTTGDQEGSSASDGTRGSAGSSGARPLSEASDH